MFSALMLGNFIAYAYLMLIARLMSPADYGVLVTLMSVSYVLMVLMRTIQAWVAKAVSSGPGERAGEVRAVFGRALRVALPLSVAVFALHWMASGMIADFLHLSSAVPVIMLGAYTATTFLVPIPRGLLLGINRLHIAGAVHISEDATRLIAGTLLVAGGLGVSGAIGAYAIGNVIALLIALIPLWPLLSLRPSRWTRSGNFEGIDGYALSLLLVNACLMIIASLDQIAVKRFFSDETAGNYAVAFMLGRIIVASTISFSWVIFTRSVAMTECDPLRARLLLKGLLVVGAISATLTTAYLLVPSVAIGFMGGSQYGSARNYVGLVGIEMTLFAIVYVQAFYHMSVKKMQVMWPLCLAVLIEIATLARYHDTVQQILMTLILVMGGLVVWVSGISWRMFRADTGPVNVSARLRQVSKSGYQGDV